MQENYFIKRQRDLKEAKANEPKTGHAKRALKESMDPIALEGELRKALNNQGIEHCGDGYDDEGNEVSMFGDSSKGTAEAIAKYLKGKGFASVSIDKDDDAARDGGEAWFAVVRHDSYAKMIEGTETKDALAETIKQSSESTTGENKEIVRKVEKDIEDVDIKLLALRERLMYIYNDIKRTLGDMKRADKVNKAIAKLDEASWLLL